MASQSPSTDGEPESYAEELEGYREGWVAVSKLMDSGASWSGNERNCAYLNLGDGTFADISAVANLDFKDDGRASARVDWDGDGALDVWIKNRTSPSLRFLHNRAGAGAPWVAVRLVGTECNTDAVGARVLLEAGGKKYVREVRAGDGYMSQSSSWLHFGLEEGAEIDSFVVRWPGGGEQRIDGLAPGARYRVVQGESEPVRLPARAVSLGEGGDEWPESPSSSRIVLRTPLPLPPGLQRALYGDQEPGRARLLSLWGQHCAPCIVELGEFAERAKELHHTGLDVIPINVDLPAEREAARELFATRIAAKATGPGLSSLELEEGPMIVLQVLLDSVVAGREEGGVLPTSVLVDRHDMIAVVYLGPVDLDVLVEDAIRFGLNPAQAGTRSSHPGRWFFGMPRNLEALYGALEAAGQRRAGSFFRALLQVQKKQAPVQRKQG